MAEALWVQTTGVDYSAAEDRRLIWSLAQPGIARGLQIQIVSGLNVKVTAGSAVIGDNSGVNDTTCYVGYTTTDTTLLMPQNATTPIWISVDPTSAATTITSGTTPTNPHLQLGTVVSTTSVAAGGVSLTSAKAIPPGLAGTYLPIGGGTLTSSTGLTTQTLQVSDGLHTALSAISQQVSAPYGVILGGGTRPTARHYCRVSKSSSMTGILTGTWTSVTFGTTDAQASDYGVTPHSNSPNSERLVAGPAGDYAIGGGATFGDPTTNVGYRRSRVLVFNSAGSIVRQDLISTVPVVADIDQYLRVSFATNVYIPANGWVECQVWHNQGNNEPLDIVSGGSSQAIWASMRLIQAD